MDPHVRFKNYDKDHCWQKEMRIQNLDQDLLDAGMTKEEADSLRISDFEFAVVEQDDKAQKQEIKEFIERHEWLGKIPQRPSHWFTARLKKNGMLGGVIIMGNPYQNATSIHKVLLDGKKSDKNIERLIARGAGISWSPKNLASWLLSKSMGWMVKNTETRLFTAYSDVEAKELGTVYQAANFIYLGKSAGTAKQYLDPLNPSGGWFSDREFRKKGKYFKYAKEAGIPRWVFEKHMNKYAPKWDTMPKYIKDKILKKRQEYMDRCTEREVPPKHKYIQILGENGSETKILRKRFEKAFPEWTGHDPHRLGLPYPTERGK